MSHQVDWEPGFESRAARVRRGADPSISSQFLATGTGDITHVMCVTYSTVLVSKCDYGSAIAMRSGAVHRLRFDASLKLVDVKEHTVVGRWQSTGPDPRPCDTSIHINGGAPILPINGGEPDFTGVLLSLPAFSQHN
jgi:hypothetical protein